MQAASSAARRGGGGGGASLGRSATGARRVAELRTAFALFDRDGSGSIDLAELRACLRALGQHPTPVELMRLHAAMDTNGDGGEFSCSLEPTNQPTAHSPTPAEHCSRRL